MREDENSPKAFGSGTGATNRRFVGWQITTGNSLSGNENNNLFLNQSGQQFADVSGISGADHPADGRAVARLDYDRDGWVDLAVVNANAPLLQLFRNEIGDTRAPPRSMLALRFVGANHSPKPMPGLAPRDGDGAFVEIQLGDAVLVRERRTGEGFASQSSDTLLVGLGDAQQIEKIRVRWPSGDTQEYGPLAVDSLVTLYQNAEHSPDGSGHSVTPYRIQGLARRAAARGPTRIVTRKVDTRGTAAEKSNARLRLFTTMATWCEACRGELPQVARLRSAFSESELDLLGVPVDEDDDTSKLEKYLSRYRPAYQMLLDMSEQQIANVKHIVISELKIDALPAAILTDRNGRVLETYWEVPPVSEIRRLLAESKT